MNINNHFLANTKQYKKIWQAEQKTRRFLMQCTRVFYTKYIAFSHILECLLMTLIYFILTNTYKVLFEAINEELHYFSVGITKSLFFHKQSPCDRIPLRLSTTTLNSIKIKLKYFSKFLGVVIVGNIVCHKQIELVEKKKQKQ